MNYFKKVWESAENTFGVSVGLKWDGVQCGVAAEAALP